MKVLDIRIDNLNEEDLLIKIIAFLNEEKFHQIATINPEFILTAQKNVKFKNVLNNCDLNVADGFGIKCAFLRFGRNLKARFTGADLMIEILKIANSKGLNVFLVANSRGLSGWKETRDSILQTFPNLEINGVDCNKNGMECAIPGDSDVVFCNFGAPFQEKFLNAVKNDKIRLVMGVGGSFDFITKKVKRAPVFMRKTGLEWLWRLIQQPRRIRRMFNAVVIFPIRVLFNK